MLCRTKSCTRNSVPEGFGYCNVCFSRIMEIRKTKALEKIANQLELLNNSNSNFIYTEKQTNKKIENKKINKIQNNDNDFIPILDISNIKSTNITVETKTEKGNLKKIKDKLQTIN